MTNVATPSDAPAAGAEARFPAELLRDVLVVSAALSGLALLAGLVVARNVPLSAGATP